MTNVVEIKKPWACEDIVAGLRGLADRLEAGEVDLSTTCVVALGHTIDRREGDDILRGSKYSLFGFGPRCDTFTIRGLLLSVATQELPDED